MLRSLLCTIVLLLLAFHAAAQGTIHVGVARVDVTPAEPIRMTGYAVRKTPSEGVEQKLWAKALVVEDESRTSALLITLDNCGVAEDFYKELMRRLEKSAGLKQEQIALALSHTHTGPCTKNWAPNIFVQDIKPEEQAVIDRYTAGLLGKLEEVAVAALKDRKPGKLSWTQGKVEFAKNRRTEGGPVDHALPVLIASDTQGKPRAIVANYACHCTTLGGNFNKVCGDWAGYAQEEIERQHPGAMSLVTIGCGADSNPHPRGGPDAGLALAKKHGAELATEVNRLLKGELTPIKAALKARSREIELPFAPHFTREQWEERAKKTDVIGYHAKKNLARLDRGEKLPTKLYYPIVTWSFGDELTMVFLPGEVVVDFALRLKKEMEGRPLWITGYANYVPCYIPSRRILTEGGYEAEYSLWYYDRPARLSTETEDLIVKTVHELTPKLK
jgi:hypothetical protein